MDRTMYKLMKILLPLLGEVEVLGGEILLYLVIEDDDEYCCYETHDRDIGSRHYFLCKGCTHIFPKCKKANGILFRTFCEGCFEVYPYLNHS